MRFSSSEVTTSLEPSLNLHSERFIHLQAWPFQIIAVCQTNLAGVQIPLDYILALTWTGEENAIFP